MANKAFDKAKQFYENKILPIGQVVVGVGLTTFAVIEGTKQIPSLGYGKEQEAKHAPAPTPQQKAALNYVMGVGY